MLMRIVVTVIGLVSIVGCGQALYQHRLPQRPAEIVYVGSQVEQLEAEKLPKGRLIYVELMLENGERVSGKLVRINWRTIELSTGFLVTSSRPPVMRENQRAFSKNEVIAMRLWNEK